MPDESLRDILLRIESRLDGHDRCFQEQKDQLNTLTEFTVTSLNSIDKRIDGVEDILECLGDRVERVEQTLESLDHRTLRLELTFEDFRSDSRVFWEHLSETRSRTDSQQEQLDQHQLRLSRLEAS